jgi:hypothetical protein
MFSVAEMLQLLFARPHTEAVTMRDLCALKNALMTPEGHHVLSGNFAIRGSVFGTGSFALQEL